MILFKKKLNTVTRTGGSVPINQQEPLHTEPKLISVEKKKKKVEVEKKKKKKL